MAAVFRLLFGLETAPRHLRELSRQSGLAVGTVRQELRRLGRLGLILERADGNRRLFWAHQAHPLFPEIRNLVLKTDGLASILRDRLARQVGIRVAFVFGSLARAAGRAGSDLDLLVVGSLGLRALTAQLQGVGEKLGREINPHLLTEAEFRRRKLEKEHFLSSVLDGPRIFVLGGEDELAHLG